MGPGRRGIAPPFPRRGAKGAWRELPRLTGAPSVRVAMRGAGQNSQQQDAYVEPQGPVVDVVEVVLDTRPHLVVGVRTARTIAYRISILLLRHKIDQGRHPVMSGALADHAVVLADLDDGEVTERLLQDRAGIEVLDLVGSASAVLELLRTIALHQDQPAGFQRLLHPAEHSRPQRRPDELHED